MRRACPYRGENPGPGKDVHGELDHRPGIRERHHAEGVSLPRTLDPARMFMESLTTGPELENSQGQKATFLRTAFLIS
jgi:hypothetical protein